MNVDELTLLRRLAADEPADVDAARAEVWRRLQASDRRPDGRTRLPSRRAGAIAAMIVVAGLLVAPALAIGDHLLGLIIGQVHAAATCRHLRGRPTAGGSRS